MWPTRILFAWSLVTTAFAWRPIDDCPNDRLCLTSFKWCSRDQDSRGSCYYPPDVYPYTATDYVTRYVLPSFHFHLTVAYCILRNAGVPFVVMDFFDADRDYFINEWDGPLAA